MFARGSPSSSAFLAGSGTDGVQRGCARARTRDELKMVSTQPGAIQLCHPGPRRLVDALLCIRGFIAFRELRAVLLAGEGPRRPARRVSGGFAAMVILYLQLN